LNPLQLLVPASLPHSQDRRLWRFKIARNSSSVQIAFASGRSVKATTTVFKMRSVTDTFLSHQSLIFFCIFRRSSAAQGAKRLNCGTEEMEPATKTGDRAILGFATPREDINTSTSRFTILPPGPEPWSKIGAIPPFFASKRVRVRDEVYQIRERIEPLLIQFSIPHLTRGEID
jgi:hypothetical protein